MLARGWLAYPVTPMHAHLPPKSGCRNVIPRFAPSRRRATALFRNPVCKAQRSVPGFSSTPNSACRRYATSPPSIGLRIPIVRHHHRIAHPHRPPSSSDCPIGAMRKNRRRAVSYVSTGLACLPRDTNASPIYRRRAVVETSSLGLHPLVAERRHSSVTRYAKRSVACRDSPRHQTLRAGGTPLPRHPSDCASTSSAIII